MQRYILYYLACLRELNQCFVTFAKVCLSICFSACYLICLLLQSSVLCNERTLYQILRQTPGEKLYLFWANERWSTFTHTHTHHTLECGPEYENERYWSQFFIQNSWKTCKHKLKDSWFDLYMLYHKAKKKKKYVKLNQTLQLNAMQNGFEKYFDEIS